ncbi:MAG: hypothetical protein Q9184_002768 [Pyrenodesmia sp. 2 TL-2023]
MATIESLKAEQTGNLLVLRSPNFAYYFHTPNGRFNATWHDERMRLEADYTLVGSLFAQCAAQRFSICGEKRTGDNRDVEGEWDRETSRVMDKFGDWWEELGSLRDMATYDILGS